MILLYLSLILFSFGSSQAQVTFTTIPEQNPGEDKIYVEANVGDVDVSIYCKLSTNTATTWKIDDEQLMFELANYTSITAGYDYLNIANDIVYEANLTFSIPFTKSHDRLEVECFGGGNSSTFFLFGIPVPPKLDNASAVYDVVEGESFTLDLSSSSDPFPPVTSTWTVSGMVITQQSAQQFGITLDTYSINISSVDRTQTGNVVQLNVSNKHGYDVKAFTFNVKYPPDGIVLLNNSIVYGALNGTASLVAHIQSLVGNPTPNITWVDPNGSVITFPHDRFTNDVSNILIVDGIAVYDYGSYLYVADNGIGDKLTIEITLEQAFPPAEPEALKVDGIGDQSASVGWNAPANMGLPALSGYKIEVTSEYGTRVMVTNDTMFVLTGLYPGTVYMVTVKTISDIFPDGGDDDVMTTFETDLSEVELKNVFGENEQGNIAINYDLRHTGGYDNENISVEATCNIHDEIEMGSGNSDADLSNSCALDCFDEDDTTLQGSLTMSDSVLNAGDVYDCTVHVSNPSGSVSFRTNPITLITGKPSIPILMIDSTNDMVVLHMRTVYAGIIYNVTDGEAGYFAFNVIVKTSSGRVVYNKTLPITRYRTNSTETITLEGVSMSGNYTVSVSASNVYGVSDTAEIDLPIIYPSSSTSPTPTTRPTTTDRDRGVIIAVAVAVSVAVVIIATLIIATIAVIAVVWNKKKMGKVAISQPTTKENNYEMSTVGKTTLV